MLSYDEAEGNDDDGNEMAAYGLPVANNDEEDDNDDNDEMRGHDPSMEDVPPPVDLVQPPDVSLQVHHYSERHQFLAFVKQQCSNKAVRVYWRDGEICQKMRQVECTRKCHIHICRPRENTGALSCQLQSCGRFAHVVLACRWCGIIHC